MTEPIIYKDDGEMLVGSKTLKCSFSGVNAKLTTTSPSLKEQWCVKEYDPNAQPDYSKMYFIFQFKDGETAKYRMDKDCHTLEQFLDRMNDFHELEKENKRLQEQLNEANEVIKEFMNKKPLSILCKEERDKLDESKDRKMAKQYLERFGIK